MQIEKWKTATDLAVAVRMGLQFEILNCQFAFFNFSSHRQTGTQPGGQTVCG
jgi:hypothetical protein